jgi:hypothetical protein
MNSQFFKLNLQDVGKGAVTAVIGAVLGVLYGAFNQPGFDLFNADWAQIASDAVKLGVNTGFAYLIKNLLSDTEGKFMGKI